MLRDDLENASEKLFRLAEEHGASQKYLAALSLAARNAIESALAYEFKGNPDIEPATLPKAGGPIRYREREKLVYSPARNYDGE